MNAPTHLRQYIRNDFAERQKANPHFSLRSYAKWLGISPAQISQILSGKRPISHRVAEKIFLRLNLSSTEQRLLLTPDQGTAKKKKQPISTDKFELISDWYYLAILSLSKIKDNKSDPRWIAQRLGIPVQVANKALTTLIENHVIQVNEDKSFEQILPLFEVFSEVPSEPIRKFHKQILALSMHKLDAVPPQHRFVNSTTVPFQLKKLKILHKLAEHLLDEVDSLSEKDENDEVYHISIQAMPLTQLQGDKK